MHTVSKASGFMQAAELHAGTCRVILSSSVHYVSRISVCTFTLFTFSKCGAPLTQLELVSSFFTGWIYYNHKCVKTCQGCCMPLRQAGHSARGSAAAPCMCWLLYCPYSTATWAHVDLYTKHMHTEHSICLFCNCSSAVLALCNFPCIVCHLAG